MPFLRLPRAAALQRRSPHRQTVRVHHRLYLFYRASLWLCFYSKDVKPFDCPSCEKSYSDPATLTRHKKAKHGHRPHHTARYYLAREEAAAGKTPSQKPKSVKKRSSSRRNLASDVPAWSALQDDDFAPPMPLDSHIETLPSFKDLKLGDDDTDMRGYARESRPSLFTQSADGRYRLPELPTMRPRPLTSMYRAPPNSNAFGVGRMSSSPSLSPGPIQWHRPTSPLPDHADDDYYYRSHSSSSSTLSDRSMQQSYRFVGRGMFQSGRGWSESDEEEIDELVEGDEEFIPYRRVTFIKSNCPSKGRTSQGPLFRY